MDATACVQEPVLVPLDVWNNLQRELIKLRQQVQPEPAAATDVEPVDVIAAIEHAVDNIGTHSGCWRYTLKEQIKAALAGMPQPGEWREAWVYCDSLPPGFLFTTPEAVERYLGKEVVARRVLVAFADGREGSAK